MAALAVRQLAMPFQFGENGRTQRLQHAFFVQPLQRNLIRGMKTGLDLPVGSDADPVAVGTEMCAYRADETDVSLRVGKPVKLGNSAV